LRRREVRPTPSRHKRKPTWLNAPKAKGIGCAQLVNALLKKDIELIEAAM
jgi:hypothetical protein